MVRITKFNKLEKTTMIYDLFIISYFLFYGNIENGFFYRKIYAFIYQYKYLHIYIILKNLI